jgi:hypothetical protein
MLVIAIDAVVFMDLLKMINDDDVGFGTSILVALGASIGTSLLVFGLVYTLGLWGLLLSALLAIGLLGVAVSAMFGVEIKRSFLIAGVFTVVHVAVSLGLSSMLQA